jgi:membrane protease YdiL (CAAX protease family)
MRYLLGMVGCAWVTILFCIAFFPITIPVLLSFPWLMWGRPSRRTAAAVPRSVWLPAPVIAAMFLWGTAFSQPTRGPWQGYRWPALVALLLFVVACVLGWRVWQRSGRDRRVTALLMLQLWFGAVATFVVVEGVSPGNGLGAL